MRRAKVKESTWAGYQDAVEGRIIPAIGALPLRKVTPKHIAKLYDNLLASGSRDPRRGPGLAPKTVRNTGLVLKKAFGDAVRLGLLARNPAQHVELPRVEQNEMKTWSTEQAREFIGFIRGDRLEALWILMLTSGMRRGELIGLTGDRDRSPGCGSSVSIRRLRGDPAVRPIHESARAPVLETVAGPSVSLRLGLSTGDVPGHRPGRRRIQMMAHVMIVAWRWSLGHGSTRS